jgi:hypothetical protein
MMESDVGPVMLDAPPSGKVAGKSGGPPSKPMTTQVTGGESRVLPEHESGPYLPMAG